MGLKEEIKSSFKSNQEMAVVNITYTYNWLRDLQNHSLKKHKILQQHYNVLRIVNGKEPEASYPGQIKEVMLDKGRDLTRLVDKLVSLKLLKRQSCEENRRMVEIRITDKGKKVIRDIESILNETMNEHIKISDKDALQLSQLLDKIRNSK